MDHSAVSEWQWFIIAQLMTAAAIYGGIRADLRNLARSLEDVRKATDSAHQRIDDILNRRLDHEARLQHRP